MFEGRTVPTVNTAAIVLGVAGFALGAILVAFTGFSIELPSSASASSAVAEQSFYLPEKIRLQAMIQGASSVPQGAYDLVNDDIKMFVPASAGAPIRLSHWADELTPADLAAMEIRDESSDLGVQVDLYGRTNEERRQGLDD